MLFRSTPFACFPVLLPVTAFPSRGLAPIQIFHRRPTPSLQPRTPTPNPANHGLIRRAHSVLITDLADGNSRARRVPEEMTDSTPPIDTPPEQHGSNDEEAARAPPPRRLQLEVSEPLLRLIRSMRSASVPAQAGGAPRAAVEEDQLRAQAQKGRRRLRDRKSTRLNSSHPV